MANIYTYIGVYFVRTVLVFIIVLISYLFVYVLQLLLSLCHLLSDFY